MFIPLPEKQSKNIQDIGYSKAEALEHCQKRGGNLLDISSQVNYSNLNKNRYMCCIKYIL